MNPKPGSVKTEIDCFKPTDEKICNRAGLTLVSKYLSATGIIGILATLLKGVKKSSKGVPLKPLLHQLLCFFFDGTDFHLTRFDALKQDASYAAVIETEGVHMLSSHAVKRFFANVSRLRANLLRKALHRLFLWRLNQERPEVITLGIDTMVLDNDDSKLREGVEPTYKKVKGFQPLQVFWGRILVDAIFRGGSAHSNHGNHVKRVITHLVALIRAHYRPDVPIIICADAGFFDQQLFSLFDSLGLGFVIGGKLYADLKAYTDALGEEQFLIYQKDRGRWLYCEIGSRRKNWKRFYRSIYTKSIAEADGQFSFGFDRVESIIYTNLGMKNRITELLSRREDHGESYLPADAVIRCYHERARDELVNRGLKDFATEHLPFKCFASNAAFYYLLVISFVVFESFKADMHSPAIPVTWYAQTFRRCVLDIAGKIVKSARRLTLAIPRVTCELLDLSHLWYRISLIDPIPAYST